MRPYLRRLLAGDDLRRVDDLRLKASSLASTVRSYAARGPVSPEVARAVADALDGIADELHLAKKATS